ncbi:hypothetical protein ABFS82_07G001400 [Erythranthe guttata]|uniref:YTH domain-containing family protein n=2 Tax=Erythranthe guttata TaxID=4155 RepID=A0A022QE26_ERYGU|nr:PREDICTED: uncharacterized protein LOC105970496 isoform X1 [Erythranthe guttata]XP_012850784.1 PREDICTED: uncharacterized protein LOC105970496 isoform X1 [Erythranthe guttata]EYU26196.1 hypothetical protein MIMGU_mgv1a026173mg [Erythranthe guttata]|eukprot:XP_012850782.1 PREDICTED: uncharacterized protein LOC105970496 isoform X1 [Erythranthe guttata]
MEVYNVPGQGLADMYLIQGSEPIPQFISQFEPLESMYNEGAPDYFVDQGLYYPPTTNYGYICTGFESTGDWEDHQRIFGLDGQDLQYTGVTNENLPYVYYNPSYGYGQSPYNPYNPYIPGAMIGLDGSIVAPQQYYAIPSYENPISSPSYVPVVLQSRPESRANGIGDSFVDNAVSVSKVDGLVSRYNLPPNTPNSSLARLGDNSSRRNSSARMSEGGGANTGSVKQHWPNVTSVNFTNRASSQISLARDPQGTENALRGKASSASSQSKSAFTSAKGLSGFESSNHAQASVHRVKPNALYDRVTDAERASPDALREQNGGPLIEQNRGSRTNKLKNELVVRAYTTRAGNPDAQGNITIFKDQYNKIDFPVDYANAKFFVIKSYSEDDVHKSIKYNVWSSTPNGNKKLTTAYQDAHRTTLGDLRGCPIFLFFSVNASGQFCGVAEMTGPVDFHRDMDFWQQDKWSGSFPVKWHIIKDLPNSNFRHIILENNENKPVTNSRDTQEICYEKGLEMLRIYKSHTLKTSLLDDFMYYENRQRILQEERTRLLRKSYENQYLVPQLDPPRKLQYVHDFPYTGDVNGTNNDADNLTIVNKNKVSEDSETDSSVTKKHCASTEQVSSSDSSTNKLTSVSESGADGVPKTVDELKMSSLTINAEKTEPECPLPSVAVSSTTKKEQVKVVTIGSMAVKVTGNESCGFLTVGTIPLDPRALKGD